MKAIFKNVVLTGVFGFGLISLSSCSKEQMNSEISSYGRILEVSNNGTSQVVSQNLESVVLSESMVLSENELQILLKLKEEEKFARDVYSALNLKWNNQVLSNITNAENTHMNAIIYLLQNYGEEYMGVLEPGKFTNPEFQKLYDELVSKGSVSVQDTWMVGALIEEMDITDLSVSISNVTNENVIMVFENLQKGSRNHLRAFTRQLTALGLTYNPVYLSTSEYNQIISSPNESGNQYQMRGKGNGKGQFGKGNCNL
jgi:hypothetical protein